jgi:hypothetical protein
VDRDGDGLIKTSHGLGNILPWTNAGGADTHGGVTTADDECIINYTRVIGTNTRTVAVDANNDVWTGGSNQAHEQISGVTGLPIPGTQFNLLCGGYGGLVDGNNVLWSARFGNNLLRYDVGTMTGNCLDGSRGDYGLGIDPQTGEIWHTNLSGNRIARVAPNNGDLIAAYGHGSEWAQGVAVDGAGNVWVAHSLVDASTTVGHLRTDGTFVGNVPLPGGSGPTGVAVDANGKIWVANIFSDNAMRIDPNAGPIGGGGFPVGAVDLVVDLGLGAGPYNYSDMTGFVVVGSTAPEGFWTVTFDGMTSGLEWGTVSWNSIEPGGTSVSVEVRAADNIPDLASEIFVPVVNGIEFSGVTGEFIEVRTTLARTLQTSDTPILFDLTVQSQDELVNCPRSAGFWSQQCAQKGNGSTKFSLQLVRVIAEHVDDLSAFFEWPAGMELEGLCATIPPDPPMSPKKQAKRQFAALLANVCAGDLELVPANDEPIYLSRDTEIFCPGLSAGTIGELLVEVDQSLLDLEPLLEKDPGVRSTYGAIANCLDDINNGIGIGETCDLTRSIVEMPGEGTDGIRIGTGEDDPGDGSDAPPGIGPSTGETTGDVNSSTVRLWTVHPNPVRRGEAAIFSYVVPEGGANVGIAVYDVAGRKVADISSGFESGGVKTITWSVSGSNGRRLVHGVYFVRAIIGSQVKASRVLLVD